MTQAIQQTAAEADFDKAIAIINICNEMADDLPDGMWSDIDSSYELFKDTDKDDESREMLVDDIKNICDDHGFPFD